MNSRYDIDPEAIAPGTSHHYVLELAGTPTAVLDVGCSSGGLAAAFAAKGSRVLGLELDDDARARAEARGIECVSCDLDRDALPDIVGDRRFDVVVFADVLEHLRDPHRVLASAADVLEPGGAVVISVPNVGHAAVRLGLMRGRWDLQTYGLLDATHLRFFTLQGLRDTVAASGFLIKETRRTILPLSQAYGEVKWGREETAEAEWMIRALDGLPELETHQFVVLAEPLVRGGESSEALRQAALNAQIELRQALIERDDLRDLVRQMDDRAAVLHEEEMRVLECRDHVIGLEAQVARLTAENGDIRNGPSWRIGRAITAPVRLFRRA